jgi:sortase (surface protein transpeptidase)
MWRGVVLLALVGSMLIAAGSQISSQGAIAVFPATTDRAAEASVETPLNTTPLPGPGEASENLTAPVAPATDLAPTRVHIPSIGVNATVIDLGLDEEGRLEVPTDWDRTGWFTGRSVPGETGPGVIVGHVDSATDGAAVFYRLKELTTGDRIEVIRSDGSVALFSVTEVASFTKDDFPTDRIYGTTGQPTLRLITCGGNFDRRARSYLSNVVVFAEYLGTQEPPQARS